MNERPILAAANPPASFEQRLFDLSPVGALPTAIAIFLFLMGSFEACAALAHYSVHDQLALNPDKGAETATVLSLLLAVTLGLIRYARLKEVEDVPALARVLGCDPADLLTVEPALYGRLRWGGVLGLAIGLAATFARVTIGLGTGQFFIFLWFAIVDVLVAALFARGILRTQSAVRGFAKRVDHRLKIDLLRVDDLSVIGRGSARAALIWLSVAAVLCLSFASRQTSLVTIGAVVASAGIGVWIFFRSLSHVHMLIRNAKRAELDRVRCVIAALQPEAETDHSAATRLHGLIAYETRIEAVHEWPFDQLTMLRMGAYALIPAVPSLGQVAFKYFSGHP